MYDVYKIRKDFPIFSHKIDNRPIVYLDTAASAQKPTAVLQQIRRIYEQVYANPHRGSYTLSEQITAAYENARKTVQEFINAESAKEIIFTRNATESINLIAATWGAENLKQGDEILISQAEHHANLVPWQNLCRKTGAKLIIFAITDQGEFIKEDFAQKLSARTKLVAVTAMSNVLGSVFPLKEIIRASRQTGAKVLIDACQFIVHRRVDVQDLDCDFLAFSGHKTYGPTGIGVLYGKADLLRSMPPYQFGGDMIDQVTYEKTTYADIPARFEAGTPAAVQAIGMAEGLKYMQNIGYPDIIAHEEQISAYATDRLQEVPNLKIIGNPDKLSGVFCFAINGIHPQDIAFILNKENVCIRTGHHCAQPLVNRLGYTSLARVSFGLYTTKEDIDSLVSALLKAEKFFKE